MDFMYHLQDWYKRDVNIIVAVKALNLNEDVK